MPTWRTRTPLQRVVQILKWHCMITFAADLDNRPPSILLTTLAGRAYDGEPDLFTAVRIVLDNMTQFVERRGDEWWVPNPAHEEENFTDKWNDYPERRKAFYRWYDQITTTMNDLAAMEGKGLDAVYGRLAETFDREPVMKSYQRYAAEMSGKQLRMGATGLLTASAPVHRAPGTRAHLPRPWSPPARLTSACNSPRSRTPFPKHRERYVQENYAAPLSCSPPPPAASTPRG